MTIYFTNRQMKAAGWISATFLFGIIAQVADQYRSLLASFYATSLAPAAFWGSCICVVMAYSSRTQAKPNLKMIGALFCIGMAVVNATDITPVQAVLMDWISAGILMCGAMVLKHHRGQYTHNLLFWFNLLCVGVFVMRPMIIIMDIAPAPMQYSYDFYTAVLYLSSSILSVIGANIIFVALGADLVEQHQKEALADPLTGLLNRRGMSNIFRDMDADPDKLRQPGRAVLLFDIDHFKSVNDEFGHDVGDTVLANIGHTVTQIMQQHGQASRSGGEEFVFLFNMESSPAAFLVAEHLRVALSLLKHEGMPDDRRVTASFGLAFTRPDEPMKRLIRRADVALYAAKDAGRNRLRIAEGDSLPDADESMILPRPSQKEKRAANISVM
ncbi:GGDEF domain-containing protein [Sphingorhabdus arenilitoris]|uniref:diguanylate cyclase n=1 Tax=Sphingorhabdus arenilitoris TaxID=1490041 RepID=A0ABV8RJM9_9SPHN